jgi:hypothetical protein
LKAVAEGSGIRRGVGHPDHTAGAGAAGGRGRLAR